MIYLFSDAGMEALRRFVDRETLFAFDLDGTLAPIVAEPTAIRIPDTLQQDMARLSELAATAVVTGRARSDALRHLAFHPRYLVGNHGVEGLPGMPGLGEELRSRVSAWEEQLDRLLSPEVQRQILLERKGFSLSLHYRHADHHEAVHRAMLAAIDQLTPTPRRVGGKFVENLIPEEAPHKGDALLRLMEDAGCRRALFAGDDVTDEDVFRLASPAIFGVQVGMARQSSAPYGIRNQEEMPRLLELLLDFLSP